MTGTLALALSGLLALGAAPAVSPLKPPSGTVVARELGREQRTGAQVRDLRLRLDAADGPHGQKAETAAYLVEPTSSGRHPAVLFVHWLGEPATTNRNEFLDEAVTLAKQHGVTCLLIDELWAEKDWFDHLAREDDAATSAKAVVRIRRALDFLAAQPTVDAKHLALVGHDFGGMYGAIAGALDGRPRTYVILTAVPRLADWFLLGDKPKDEKLYRESLSELDPVRFVSRLQRPVLFQFARTDKYVSRAQADELAAAAPNKSVLRYDADHALNVAQARKDRERWLVEKLELAK